LNLSFFHHYREKRFECLWLRYGYLTYTIFLIYIQMSLLYHVNQTNNIEHKPVRRLRRRLRITRKKWYRISASPATIHQMGEMSRVKSRFFQIHSYIRQDKNETVHFSQTSNWFMHQHVYPPPSTNLKDMIIEKLTLSQSFIQKSVLINNKIHNILHSMIYKFMIAHFSNTCLLTTDLHVRWKNLQSLSNSHTLQARSTQSFILQKYSNKTKWKVTIKNNSMTINVFHSLLI